MALQSRTGAPACGVRRGRCVSVHARFGGDSGLILGPGGGNPRQQGGAQRLILPGQQQSRPGQQRIVTPDRQGGRPGTRENFLPDDSTLGLVGETQQFVGGPPTLNKYRPPAGFMNDTLPDDGTAELEPQEMLNRLRVQAGHWHELARFIPALNTKGYSSAAIDEITGVTPVTQNKWVVAATVYESVKAAAAPEVLKRFDGNGADLLYPFRFLSAERRAAAATFIVEQDLDAQLCEVLARSMKEYERRPLERTGFTEHPADCLAFKYLRDAIECRRREDAIARVELGLQVAVTEGARERLAALLDEKPTEEDVAASGKANLLLLRLNPDELGTRPVCVAGELGRPTLEDFQSAPRTSQSGAFGIFRIELDAPSSSAAAAAGHSAAGARRAWEWVSLPQWRALAMARHPVALTLRDCSTVPAVVSGARAKSDDDKRRLQGQGVLVCDADPRSFAELDDASWYLAAPEPGRPVGMVDGPRARQLSERGLLCGVVLFLARPPANEVADRGTDLLQM